MLSNRKNRFLILCLGAALPLAAAHAGSLHSALEYTYANNPRLNAARASERASQSEVRAAEGGWFPKLSFTGSISRNNTSGVITFFPEPLDFSQSLHQRSLALRLDQPIYEGGAISAHVSKARNEASALHASTQALEANVLLSTVQAYLQVVAAQSNLKVQENNVRVLQHHLMAARESLKHGEGTRTDVAQAEAHVDAAVASRIAADNKLAQARANYQAIVGQQAVGLKLPHMDLRLPVNLTQAQALARENYPVIAANFQAQAATDAADAATAKLKPSIGFFAEVQRESEPEFGFNQVDNRVVGVEVSIPIWQGGTNWAQREAARQKAQAAQLRVNNTRREAIAQAISAWQSYAGTAATLRAVKAQLVAARTAYSGVELAHKHGQRTLLDVLNAEQAVRTAQLAIIRAKVQRIEAAYTLLSATGQLSARNLKLTLAPKHAQVAK